MENRVKFQTTVYYLLFISTIQFYRYLF